jgi:hypothetical protein
MPGVEPHISSMILTPIPREQLSEVLDRFGARLDDPLSRAVFRRIRATSPDRAVGAVAERHRKAALALARRTGMAVYPETVECAFNWDGAALNSATEAYVILHEAAHFVLAPVERRRLIDFGLGPGPDTSDREAAEQAAVLAPLAREEDEAAASLLGIVWEAKLAQPALASFLDQNWLEGLDRSAHAHFAAVLDRLRQRGFLDVNFVVSDTASTDRPRRVDATRTSTPGTGPDPGARQRVERAEQRPQRRPARPASTPRLLGPAGSRWLTGVFPDFPSEPPSRSGTTPDQLGGSRR